MSKTVDRASLRTAGVQTLRELLTSTSADADALARSYLRMLCNQIHSAGGVMGLCDSGPLSPMMREANTRSTKRGYL